MTMCAAYAQEEEKGGRRRCVPFSRCDSDHGPVVPERTFVFPREGRNFRLETLFIPGSSSAPAADNLCSFFAVALRDLLYWPSRFFTCHNVQAGYHNQAGYQAQAGYTKFVSFGLQPQDEVPNNPQKNLPLTLWKHQ